MKTIAIMNQKGGTAKTVTTINVAAILARDYGQNVLIVDADSQGNLTEFMAREKIKSGTFADLLRGDPAVAVATMVPKTELLAADDSLMALDITAASSGIANPMALADYLADHPRRWDWCLIDCPPAFSAAAVAALIAADAVLIPTKVDAFGVRGMANMQAQIQNMRRLNRDIEVVGVLPVMVYPGQEQAEQEAKIRHGLQLKGVRCFRHIRRSTKLDEMTFRQIPLIYSSPKGKATHDYRVFVRDLLAAEGGAEHV